MVAFWALAVITPSFYLRHKIGNAPGALHFATFGCFLAAALHGITAGTDTGRPAMVVLYATTLTAVLGLIVLRLVKAGILLTPGGGRRQAPAETAASCSNATCQTAHPARVA